jgi:Mg/Co/Ni transporter MgtE
MAEYNLLALPVVDAHGNILGVITADDAMQVILPAGWKRRLPHIYS